MLASVKAVLPTIDNTSTSMGLSNASRNLTTSLAELRLATARAQEITSAPDLEVALDVVQALEQELGEILLAVKSGDLVCLPGETAESSAQQLGSSSKTVGSLMAQLLTASLRVSLFIFRFLLITDLLYPAVTNTNSALQILC